MTSSADTEQSASMPTSTLTLLADGADDEVLADLSEANLAEAKAELEAGGGIVKTVVTDVADQASFQNLHDEVYGDAEFGECAFLFLNVSSPSRRAFCVCAAGAARMR